MNPENNNPVLNIMGGGGVLGDIQIAVPGARVVVNGHLAAGKVTLAAGTTVIIEQHGSVAPDTVFKCRGFEESSFVAGESPVPLIAGTEITSHGDQLVVTGAGAPVAEGE